VCDNLLAWNGLLSDLIYNSGINDMDKVFINCRYAFTQQCPEINGPLIKEILLKLPIKDITSDTVEALNELCRNCDSFEVKQ
jgi:hypothetical protein